MLRAGTPEGRSRMGKKQKQTDPERWAKVRRRGTHALTFIWPTVLIVGGYVAWHHWGEERVGQVFYQVTPDAISIPETPDYIRTDLVAEVFQATGLSAVSLLDRQSAAQIAHAFETNPWVAKVDHVQKLAAGRVDVQLRYRQPVAMVEVISKHPEVKGKAFFAVDGLGYLLPRADFAAAETNKYVHIKIPDVYPVSDAGTPFGDVRVEAAARLAALIGDRYRELGVRAITAEQRAQIPGEQVPLKLTMADGRELLWGSAPGEELPGEMTAAGKMELLASDPSPADGADLRISRALRREY